MDQVRTSLRGAHREAEALAARIEPYAEAMDRSERFDPEVLDIIADGNAWPSLHGTLDAPAGLTLQCAWIEAIAARCTSTAVLVQSQGTVAHTLVLSGGRLGRQLVEEMREGVLLGWALTEPGAGSDVLSMRLTAKPVEGGYLLSGEKRFITNVGMARYYLIFARTKAGRARDVISAFVVPADSPGLVVPRTERKMGLRASATGDLALDEVFVPAAARVGDEGAGLPLALDTLRWSRPLIGAVSLGVARAAYEHARRLLAGTDAARAALRLDQGTAHGLARMVTLISAARALLYSVAERADVTRSLPPHWEASAAKLFCSDVAMEVADRAVSLAGMPAAIESSPLERILRDAKILQIFEGTNEIQRNAIAKELPSMAPAG